MSTPEQRQSAWAVWLSRKRSTRVVAEDKKRRRSSELVSSADSAPTALTFPPPTLKQKRISSSPPLAPASAPTAVQTQLRIDLGDFEEAAFVAQPLVGAREQQLL